MRRILKLRLVIKLNDALGLWHNTYNLRRSISMLCCDPIDSLVDAIDHHHTILDLHSRALINL